MTLHDMSVEFTAILAAIDAADGELDAATAQRLAAYEAALPAKVDGYCALIEQLDAEAESLVGVANRLKKRADARSNTTRQLRERLKEELVTQGQLKVKTLRFNVSVQASPPSIRWGGDDDAIPAPFRKTTWSLDGTAARNWWKNNGSLPEGFQVKEGQHIRIT